MKQTIDILEESLRVCNDFSKKVYNKSFLPNMGESNRLKDQLEVTDTYYVIYETCQSFMQQQERLEEQTEDAVYVGDNGFPDALMHQIWIHEHVNTNFKANNYDVIRAQKAFEKIRRPACK
jgi:hypothetical protein